MKKLATISLCLLTKPQPYQRPSSGIAGWRGGWIALIGSEGTRPALLPAGPVPERWNVKSVFIETTDGPAIRCAALFAGFRWRSDMPWHLASGRVASGFILLGYWLIGRSVAISLSGKSSCDASRDSGIYLLRQEPAAARGGGQSNLGLWRFFGEMRRLQ